jgi:hypothetical protein
MLFRYLTGTSWLRLRAEGVVTDHIVGRGRAADRALSTTCLIQSTNPGSLARLSAGEIR